MASLLHAQAWLQRRIGDDGVDLPLVEEPYRVGVGVLDPGDVLLGVQADVRRHAGEEEVVG
jgi:hypothetical protein